jgi:hypothetical protein
MKGARGRHLNATVIPSGLDYKKWLSECLRINLVGLVTTPTQPNVAHAFRVVKRMVGHLSANGLAHWAWGGTGRTRGH